MLSLVRLTSGIELIGEITACDDLNLTIKNPLQISVFSRNNGATGIMCNRYTSFSTQESYRIKNIHVECVCKPVDELDTYYHQSLSVIKEHIDPGLVEDLKRLKVPTDENTSGDLTQESYLALIEKMMLKKPLN